MGEPRRRLERGFLIVEVAIAIAIAGVIATGVVALLIWAATVETRTSAATDYAVASHLGADTLARLIRQAGGAGQAAIGGGNGSSLILCGVRETTRTWRGRVQVDGAGKLVVVPLTAPVPPDCQGSDLPGARVLVAQVRIASVQFRYHTAQAAAPASGCNGTGLPPCADVVAVEFTLTPAPPTGPHQGVLRIVPHPVSRLVTLRN